MLVRVGALYHDVGKLDAPQFFSENQRQPSPHDAIEPRDSARVILAHTERGAELMARYRVGGRVADFAREHHGTGAVASFLQKAVTVGAEPDPADYRYPGPRPRSRETAVVMMADRIEAMARSRGAATEAEFHAVVSRTIDELLADGELDEAPLTLRDVARIREAFVTALMTLHHTREAYPALPRRAAGPSTRGAAGHLHAGPLTCADGVTHEPDPESRNVCPSIGTNSQSYLPLFNVSFRTPYVLFSNTSLLACVWPRS